MKYLHASSSPPPAAAPPRSTEGAIVLVTPQELSAIVEGAVTRALEARAPRELPPKWLDSREAAELLGVHPRTITRLVQRGDLPASRIGRVYRFRREDVEALLVFDSAS